MNPKNRKSQHTWTKAEIPLEGLESRCNGWTLAIEDDMVLVVDRGLEDKVDSR